MFTTTAIIRHDLSVGLSLLGSVFRTTNKPLRKGTELGVENNNGEWRILDGNPGKVCSCRLRPSTSICPSHPRSLARRTTPKKSFRKGRLVVSLDRSKVIPDDPGADTPAMVSSFGYYATYWCACGEGELSSDRGTLQLTEAECIWLNDLEPQVDQFLYGARK